MLFRTLKNLLARLFPIILALRWKYKEIFVIVIFSFSLGTIALTVFAQRLSDEKVEHQLFLIDLYRREDRFQSWLEMNKMMHPFVTTGFLVLNEPAFPRNSYKTYLDYVQRPFDTPTQYFAEIDTVKNIDDFLWKIKGEELENIRLIQTDTVVKIHNKDKWADRIFLWIILIQLLTLGFTYKFEILKLGR